MKIVTVIGARPQFIKAAPVSRAIRASSNISEVLVHTGQHYDHNMSGVFFRELQLDEPAYQLAIGSGSHGAQTGRMIEAIETVLVKERPDWVLVYGDTNSTLAAAIAAVKLHIRIAHVEAGLRSFNRRMPEELNRILTDHASDLLFTSTSAACHNLEREGLRHKIVRSGDVMLDAAFMGASQARGDLRQRLGLGIKGYCLATIHRAENTDDANRLRNIVAALKQLSTTLRVVLPLHPRTAPRFLAADICMQSTPAFTITEPLGYLDMIDLEKNAALIATDSGGVQKEAYFFAVPCVTMRTETEWTELVDHGFNFLADPCGESISGIFRIALKATPDWTAKLYGNGTAAKQIVHTLESRS